MHAVDAPMVSCGAAVAPAPIPAIPYEMMDDAVFFPSCDQATAFESEDASFLFVGYGLSSESRTIAPEEALPAQEHDATAAARYGGRPHIGRGEALEAQMEAEQAEPVSLLVATPSGREHCAAAPLDVDPGSMDALHLRGGGVVRAGPGSPCQPLPPEEEEAVEEEEEMFPLEALLSAAPTGKKRKRDVDTPGESSGCGTPPPKRQQQNMTLPEMCYLLYRVPLDAGDRDERKCWDVIATDINTVFEKSRTDQSVRAAWSRLRRLKLAGVALKPAGCKVKMHVVEIERLVGATGVEQDVALLASRGIVMPDLSHVDAIRVDVDELHASLPANNELHASLPDKWEDDDLDAELLARLL